MLGKTIAVWGLTFKANTDDIRDSPALTVIRRLITQGATVKAYDPGIREQIPGIENCHSAIEAATGADALTVLTEWDDFKWIDAGEVATAMTGRHVVDARNLLDRNAYIRQGFTYLGIGR